MSRFPDPPHTECLRQNLLLCWHLLELSAPTLHSLWSTTPLPSLQDMQRRSTALAMFWPKAEAAQEGQHPEATNKLNSREQHQQLLASRPMEPSLAAKFQGAQQLAVQLRKRAAEVEHFVQASHCSV